MKGLFHYLIGTVALRIHGMEHERFLNIACRRRLHPYCISRKNDCLYCILPAREFKEIIALRHKCRCKVDVLKRNGLPFFIRKYRLRIIFTLGFLQFILFLSFMSTRIWAMSISGNRQLSNEIVYDYLYEYGIRYGMKKSELDIEQLEKSIRNDFPNIVWDSVSLRGTCLLLLIKENPKDIPIENEDEFILGADMLSQDTGRVVSLITRSGIPMCKEGEFVSKEQILISGRVPIMNDDGTVRREEYVVADGDIMIETNIEYHHYIERCYNYKIFGKKEWNLYLFGFYGFTPNIQKWLSDRNISCSVDTYQLHILDHWYLPFTFHSCRFSFYYDTAIALNDDMTERMLTASFLNFVDALEEKGVQIIENNVTIGHSEFMSFIDGTVKVVKRSGSLSKIE